jgi:hypothetical protein
MKKKTRKADLHQSMKKRREKASHRQQCRKRIQNRW